FLYATTDKFLEHFGLKSLGELPNIEDIKSFVEQAVKKEDLLGKTQIVEIPQDENPAAEQPAEQQENAGSDNHGQEMIEHGSESPTQEN
ncbi:MAG TPA: hypothetical protein VD913_04935, partial [bacterium]|nr:hypothetical protein [bacterium]